MNYDWPGNLTELSSVIRRAVMLAKKDEILPEQILLGLPKTEGKWEYNILRIDWIRKFLDQQDFSAGSPGDYRLCLFAHGVVSFFRTLKSRGESRSYPGLVYRLATVVFLVLFSWPEPGAVSVLLPCRGPCCRILSSQTARPQNSSKNYSGWIMAMLCILVFWVEIIWDAYNNPYLTGGIIIIITLGSILFSVLFSRRSWCRYLCPLGCRERNFCHAVGGRAAFQQACLSQPLPESCLFYRGCRCRRMSDVSASVPGRQQQGLHYVCEMH